MSIIELSPTMHECLRRIAIGGGVITRAPGGFWLTAGYQGSFGTTTVEALVHRGKLRYSEWKETHGRKFPIQAEVVS